MAETENSKKRAVDVEKEFKVATANLLNLYGANLIRVEINANKLVNSCRIRVFPIFEL